MPSASENIIAKFIAQMDTGTNSLIRTRHPAEATSPDMVSTSGSPAATRAPNASTRISMVTGQEYSSEDNIAWRFASLKSDHRTDAPVGFTCTSAVETLLSLSLRSAATRTMSFVSAPAPPSTTAVRPSSETVTPGTGPTTLVRWGSSSRIAVTCPMTFLPSSSERGPAVLCTTTCIA